MSNLAALAVPRRRAPRPRSLKTGPAETPVVSGRVLVIDDDQSMCETLFAVLTRRGFIVEWGTVATAALKLLDERDFDVVVTDLHMDGLDGIAVCEQVNSRHPGLPVVVITAFGNAESAAAAQRVGAWAFITKPFELEALRTILAKAVLQRRANVK